MLKYIRERLQSFRFAFNGFVYLWSETNFKIHIFSLLSVIILAFLFDLTSSEWMWIIVSSALVLITESVNTVFERTLDMIQPEQDVRVGHLKDMSAAFVLIAALSAIIVAIIIFTPKILALVETII